MSEARTYNGWANYETWLVHVNLRTDEGGRRYWEKAAGKALTRADGSKKFASRCLAESLEADMDKAADDMPIGLLFSDLLTSALGEVEWEEIASAFVEGVFEQWIEENGNPDDEGDEERRAAEGVEEPCED